MGAEAFSPISGRQDILSDRDNQRGKNSVSVFVSLPWLHVSSPHSHSLESSWNPFFSKSHTLSCLPQRLHQSRPRPACGKMVSERKKILMPSPHLMSLISPTNPIGLSGKNWHGTKKAFRPTAGLTSYAKRQELKKHNDAVKELEREMKEEQEAERKVCRSESFSLLDLSHFPIILCLCLVSISCQPVSIMTILSPTTYHFPRRYH